MLYKQFVNVNIVRTQNSFAMRTIFNSFMGPNFRFAPMLLLYNTLYIGSCKNSAASRKNDTTLETQSKDNTIPNPTQTDEEGEKSNAAMAASKEHENAQNVTNHATQRNEQLTKPSFRLKDITIQAGTAQSITLEGVNITEGYMVKSVSLTKNTTTSYVKQFGLDELTNKPIPPSGLTFTLAPNQSLKPGTYLLKIKSGKTGVGSKATEQLVRCTITIPEQNQYKTNTEIPKQGMASHTVEQRETPETTTQTFHNAKVPQEDHTHKEVAMQPTIAPTPLTQNLVRPTIPLKQKKRKTHKSPVTCQFVKEGAESSHIDTVRCKIGDSIIIPYYIEDHQTHYKIKRVQIIKQGGRNSTNKELFGLDHLNKTFEKRIKVTPTIQRPGIFQLIIKIKKPNNPLLLVSKCNIDIFK